MRRFVCLLFVLAFVQGDQAQDSVAQASTDVGKYEALKTLPIGPLVLTDMKIIAERDFRPRARAEHVPDCRVLRAHVVLHSPVKNDSEWLSGDLVTGTSETPPGSMAGDFTWTNRKLTNVALSRLSLRLTNVQVHFTLAGATITIPSTQDAIIENAGPLSSSDAMGVLRVTLFGPTFHGLAIKWQGVAITTDAAPAGQGAVVLSMDLKTGAITPVEGILKTRGALNGEITDPLKTFIPGEEIRTGKMQLSGLTVHWMDGALEATADKITIPHPQISLSSYAFPVKAASELVVKSVKAQGSTTNEIISIDAPSEVGAHWVEPDTYQVIDQLNFSGKFDEPDALVPTGDPIIRFAKVSTLSRFRKELAEAERTKSPTKINRVFVQTDGNIVTDSFSDSIAFQHPQQKYPKYQGAPDPGMRDNPVVVLASIVIAHYSAEAAVHFVGKMLVLAGSRQFAGQVALATWLRVNTALYPKTSVGIAFAERIAVVSKFMSQGWVKSLTENGTKLITDFAVDHLADSFFEMVLEEGLPTSAYEMMGTNPPNYVLQPRVFANLQNSPNQYYSDDFATRYRAYLGTVVPHPRTQEENRLLKRISDANRKIEITEGAVKNGVREYQSLGESLKNLEQQTTLNQISNNINLEQTVAQDNGSTSEAYMQPIDTSPNPPASSPGPIPNMPTTSPDDPRTCKEGSNIHCGIEATVPDSH